MKRRLTLRLSSELVRCIDSAALSRKGVSRNMVMEQILSDYFNDREKTDIHILRTLQRLENIQKRMAQEQQLGIEFLAEYVRNDLTYRFIHIPDLMEKIKKQSILTEAQADGKRHFAGLMQAVAEKIVSGDLFTQKITITKNEKKSESKSHNGT